MFIFQKGLLFVTEVDENTIYQSYKEHLTQYINLIKSIYLLLTWMNKNLKFYNDFISPLVYLISDSPLVIRLKIYILKILRDRYYKTGNNYLYVTLYFCICLFNFSKCCNIFVCFNNIRCSIIV